jgi:hypothetical protein
MSALIILLIRHADKPDDPSLGPGLTAKGKKDQNSLVIRGWQRSGAWAALFASGAFGTDYPRPTVVYAVDPTKPSADDASISQRPFDTIIPLCERLHIKPVTSFGVGDENLLLQEITQLTGVVLVCWEHKKIAEAILPWLAGTQTLPGLPAKWDKARFDVVLRFDRAQKDAQWSFRQMFPKLLAGDQDVPL